MSAKLLLNEEEDANNILNRIKACQLNFSKEIDELYEDLKNDYTTTDILIDILNIVIVKLTSIASADNTDFIKPAQSYLLKQFFQGQLPLGFPSNYIETAIAAANKAMMSRTPNKLNADAVSEIGDIFQVSAMARNILNNAENKKFTKDTAMKALAMAALIHNITSEID